MPIKKKRKSQGSTPQTVTRQLCSWQHPSLGQGHRQSEIHPVLRRSWHCHLHSTKGNHQVLHPQQLHGFCALVHFKHRTEHGTVFTNVRQPRCKPRCSVMISMTCSMILFSGACKSPSSSGLAEQSQDVFRCYSPLSLSACGVRFFLLSSSCRLSGCGACAMVMRSRLTRLSKSSTMPRCLALASYIAAPSFRAIFCCAERSTVLSLMAT